MKHALLVLALLLQSAPADTDPAPTPHSFQLERALTLPAGTTGQACAVIDAPLYARTQGRLTGLRVYKLNGSMPSDEVPFALTESGEAGQVEEPARIQNLGSIGGTIVFDLAMPQRTYTSVVLSLTAQDFLGSAHVYGLTTQPPAIMPGVPYPVSARPIPPAGGTDLGTFALFDLTSQGLSRSTTLPLQEVTFPVLHIVLDLHPSPGATPPPHGFSPEVVSGAAIPPSRLAQTLYTVVALSPAFTQKGRTSVGSVLAPAFVPIERTTFEAHAVSDKNFSRTVRIAAYPGTQRPVAKGPRDEVPADETFSGEIHSVKLAATGLAPQIADQQMSLETVLTSNMRSDATVDFAIDNQDDQPLVASRAALEMRQRQLCFDAEAGTAYAVFYGTPDPTVSRAPVYDYARLFHPSLTPVPAALGPEASNSLFVPGASLTTKRSYLDRHPELLWIVLVLVVSALGTIAIRSAKHAGTR